MALLVILVVVVVVSQSRGGGKGDAVCVSMVLEPLLCWSLVSCDEFGAPHSFSHSPEVSW